MYGSSVVYAPQTIRGLEAVPQWVLRIMGDAKGKIGEVTKKPEISAFQEGGIYHGYIVRFRDRMCPLPADRSIGFSVDLATDRAWTEAAIPEIWKPGEKIPGCNFSIFWTEPSWLVLLSVLPENRWLTISAYGSPTNILTVQGVRVF